MTKAELRETFLAKRMELSEQSCSIVSHAICELFVGYFDIEALHVIHSFIPLTKNKEPDTWVIIDWIRTRYPDVRISLPRVRFNPPSLQHYYFDDRFPLQKNKWGLEEPTQGEITKVSDIDLVIVQLVAFDVKGNRVGYGKGFYDKFLATCRPDCKRVGLSFFEPVDAIDDINAFDMQLDYCITPRKVFEFGRLATNGSFS